MTTGRSPRLELAAANFDWNIDQVVADLARIRKASLPETASKVLSDPRNPQIGIFRS
jgi:hypothetical protein